MPDIVLGMKIVFLKDITVDVLDDKENTYDKLIRQGVSIDCVEVVPVSKEFSNVVLDSEEVILDLKNEVFEEVV
jgi:hypothetical protein